MKLIDSGIGFGRKELDAMASHLIPETHATMLRWIAGEKDYEMIRDNVEMVTPDERSVTKQVAPLGAADLLAPIGHNWHVDTENHQQARGGHWEQDQNGWNLNAANEEGDGWVNKLDGRKGW